MFVSPVIALPSIKSSIAQEFFGLLYSSHHTTSLCSTHYCTRELVALQHFVGKGQTGCYAHWPQSRSGQTSKRQYDTFHSKSHAWHFTQLTIKLYSLTHFALLTASGFHDLCLSVVDHGIKTFYWSCFANIFFNPLIGLGHRTSYISTFAQHGAVTDCGIAGLVHIAAPGSTVGHLLKQLLNLLLGHGIFLQQHTQGIKFSVGSLVKYLLFNNLLFV